MRFLPGWWHRYRAAFWAGPDYLQQGVRRKKHLLASIAGTVWLVGFLRRKFTLTAILMMPVMAIMLLYCLIVQQSWMLFWLLFLFSLHAVAWISSFLFRPGGSLIRTAPERVRNGEVFHLHFQLRNHRRLPAYELTLDPFSYSPALQVLAPAEIASVKGRGSAECRGEVRAKKRGIVYLYRPIAESSYPLGLIKWSIRGKMEQKIMIYPAFTPLASFSLPRGTVIRSTGTAISTLPGESPDLLGSRDFRPGDAIRHIDWPGSARKGDLVVKEFAREEFMRIAVLADTAPLHFSSGESVPLEAALSLTAALGDYMLRRGTHVDLFAAGGDLHRISGRHYRDGFQQLCDVLAAVTPDTAFRLPEQEKTLLPELQKAAAAVLILLADTPERKNFAALLESSGIPLKVILISKHHNGVVSLPANWRVITPVEVTGGAVTAL